jgi:hypothetical protein
MVKKLLLEDEDDIGLIAGLFAKAREVARPKALYKVAYVEDADHLHVTLDGVRFASEVLARNMKGVHRVFAYVCTCGAEVDDWSHAEKDYIVSLWLDIIKERFLFDAITFLREHIKKKYGIATLSAVNPGSGNVDNWPIAQQKLLFPLIGGVAEDAGVRLTDSCLMLPTKSTSGLLYASDTEFFNCSLCERKICPGRRAEYQGNVMD